MANKQIEAILKISARMGNLRALNMLQRELRRVDDATKRINRSQTIAAAGSRAMAATATASYAAVARFAAPAVLAYGAVQSYRSFAEAERQIERIGITADASAEETKAAMGRIHQAARDLHMPFQDVVRGVDAMAASGKNFTEIFTLLPAVGRAAQASGADLADMATTADAVSNSFKIAAGEMQNAFDILAFSGKAGKFELKDMSQYLPSLAPAFAALGYEGEAGLTKLAAALQIVRTETGTSGEAATAFMDVISKLESQTLVNNFKKFGVDYRKELEKAKRSGEDLLEAFVRISREAVKGDLSKLPQLFTDRQMLIGARAMINRMDEFRGLIASTAGAAGTVERDFKRVSKNVQASIDDMSNSWERFKQSMGETVAPVITPVLDVVSDYLDRNEAIAAQLEKEGLGFLERADWFSRAGEAERANKAWQAGWRQPEEREAIEAHRAYAESRRASAAAAAGFVDGQVLQESKRDKHGLPVEGPIPQSQRSRGSISMDPAIAQPDPAQPRVPVPTARPSEADRAKWQFEADFTEQQRRKRVEQTVSQADAAMIPPEIRLPPDRNWTGDFSAAQRAVAIGHDPVGDFEERWLGGRSVRMDAISQPEHSEPPDWRKFWFPEGKSFREAMAIDAGVGRRRSPFVGDGVEGGADRTGDFRSEDRGATERGPDVGFQDRARDAQGGDRGMFDRFLQGIERLGSDIDDSARPLTEAAQEMERGAREGGDALRQAGQDVERGASSSADSLMRAAAAIDAATRGLQGAAANIGSAISGAVSSAARQAATLPRPTGNLGRSMPDAGGVSRPE